MTQLPNLADLNPQPDDLVVVPMGMEIPEGVPYHVYPMKFLLAPSIVRSGGSYNMPFLNSFSFSNLAAWLGNRSPAPVVTEATPVSQEAVGMGTPANAPVDEPNYATTQMATVKAHNGMPEITLGTVDIPLGIGEFMEQQFPAPKTEVEIAKFFRYVRPFNPVQRLSGVQQDLDPRGGICFYIELDPANKTFAFSYALCHNTENFNYEIARNVSKGRFQDDNWYEVKNYDSNLSVVENIGAALYNFLYNTNPHESTDIVFSSTPEGDKVSLQDLTNIYKRIK